MNNLPATNALIILFLCAIIIYLFYKIKYYKDEYERINEFAYHAKLFIIDSGNDELWQEYIKNIGEIEEENEKEKTNN